MSTTSPNFNLILATASDTVDVTAHLATNFSTLDSVLGQAHTGTGQLKAGLTLTTPVIINPVISGTLTVPLIIATTVNAQTLLATAGTLTGLTTLFANTITATAGVLTGLTTAQASTGRFNTVTATGGILTGLTTLGANTITATGGIVTLLSTLQASTCLATLVVATTASINALTATSFLLGTYSYPTTVGLTGQILSVTTGNPVFVSTNFGCRVFSSSGTQAVAAGTMFAVMFDAERWDTNNFHSNVTTNTRLTITASGVYVGVANLQYGGGGTGGQRLVSVRRNGTNLIARAVVVVSSTEGALIDCSFMYQFGSGDFIDLVAEHGDTGTVNILVNAEYSPELTIQRIC